MKCKLLKEVQVELKTLVVHAQIRYWEDAVVNKAADKNGEKIPCRVGDNWELHIDIDTGIIINWKKGVIAQTHYKVCDCCGWELLDKNGNIELSADNIYVPLSLCPGGCGYGDYIIMTINEDGKIENWKFNIEDFIGNELGENYVQI